LHVFVDLADSSVAPSNRSTPIVFDVNGSDAYVTMDWEGYDGRRLGNQLFNMAAMLHVSRRTGRLVAMPTNSVRVDNVDWRWAIDRWFDLDPLIPLVRWTDNKTLIINT
jgi:hypothetical protein